MHDGGLEEETFEGTSNLRTELSKEAVKSISEVHAELEDTEIKVKHTEVPVTDLVARENQNKKTIDTTEVVYDELKNEELAIQGSVMHLENQTCGATSGNDGRTETANAKEEEFLSQIQNLQKELSLLSSCSLAKEKENLRKDLEKTKVKLKETESKLKNAVQEKTKLEGQKAFAEREVKRLHGQKTLLERDISKRDFLAGRRRDSMVDRSSKMFDSKKSKGLAASFEQTMQEDYRNLEILAFKMEATIASLEEEVTAAHKKKEETKEQEECDSGTILLSLLLNLSSLISQRKQENMVAAEFILTFAMQETLTRVSSIAAEGIRLAWGLKGELRKLDESLTMIQDVLQDAARRPVTDKPVKLLLEKLQDVAYNAEDVLDDFAYEILRKDQKKGKVRDWFSLHNPVVFHMRMGQKIKEINGSLDEIQRLANRRGLGLTATQHANGAPEISLDRETESFLERSEVVVGRDGDVFKILKFLFASIDQQVLTVVPIVGMAGLGKTAIAKKICQLAREKKHFDVTLWVCASNDFNKRRILGEMLQKIDEYTGGLSNLDAILQKLQQKLENKTFLLVLDDVWNEDHDMWDDLKDLLLKINKKDINKKDPLLKINKKNGNVVVVTTRSKQVASMMETSPGSQHEPGKLSDDQCWSIIKQKVSGGGGATIASDLESIGNKIGKKCGGLPLLAKVLGGTLQGKQAQEWQSILNNRFCWLSSYSKQIMVSCLCGIRFPVCAKSAAHLHSVIFDVYY
ncbi:hypothetical protein DKX38_020196 [Salix brachista]|uniref:NB-ARC domain-containing protein n=1 Tax=Salix brachista TaxID=2182728 RepID=A0A5N5KID7_9ROSI|nr:hypothetical protein DKX38_020196 [Salix brachista]